MSNYDTIRLEKGMYAGGKSLTHTLEELDPSENYRGTALEGLDAYQRQLKRFDIHVSGVGSDAVEKFFKPQIPPRCSRNMSPAPCGRGWRRQMYCPASSPPPPKSTAWIIARLPPCRRRMTAR